MDNWTFGITMVVVGMGGTTPDSVDFEPPHECFEKGSSHIKKRKRASRLKKEG